MNTTLTNILLVGLGSSLGGVSRYLVSRLMSSMGHSVFPWGTFTVNVIGCFIIGLVYGFIDKGGYMSDGIRLFITVGFCGGFTTFSTFMHENYLLFSGTGHFTVLLYVLSSIFAGFCMVYFAYYLTKL